MNPNNIKPFRPQFSRSHNIERIISAPLVAAAHANAIMQREQTKYMMETGFNEKNGRFEPVMIEMLLIQQVMDDQVQGNADPVMKTIETTFNLPILTIIPINSLAVDHVNVQFIMEINQEITQNANSSKSTGPNIGPPAKKTQLKGRISYDSNEYVPNTTRRRQNTSSLKVEVNAAPLPLPVGVNIILDLYQKAIRPVELNNKKNTESQNPNHAV
jgi:hypothetical protein